MNEKDSLKPKSTDIINQAVSSTNADVDSADASLKKTIREAAVSKVMAAVNPLLDQLKSISNRVIHQPNQSLEANVEVESGDSRSQNSVDMLLEERIREAAVGKVIAVINPLLEELKGMANPHLEHSTDGLSSTKHPGPVSEQAATETKSQHAVSEDSVVSNADMALEKRVRDAVISKVMGEINPLLEHLKKVSGQLVHQDAQAKSIDLEKSIQEKISNRMNKLNVAMLKGRF